MKQNVRTAGALGAELVKDWLRVRDRPRGLLVLGMEDGLKAKHREPRFGALWLNRWVERMQARVPPLMAFFVCAVAAAVAFYGRYVFYQEIDTRFPFLMGLPVVVLAAGIFGAGPAIGAAIVGVLLPTYYLFEPKGMLWISDPGDLFGAVLYLSISILVAITVCALSSAKSLAVEYALERRRMHQDMRNLLHELRHRTKNELMQLLALAHMMANGAETPEEKVALKAMGGRIQAVGHVHDMLAEVMDQPEAPVDSRVFLNGLLEKIRSAIGRAGITLQLDAESHPLRHTVAVPLGIVLNELTMNAIKHAFPHGAGTIWVCFHQDGDAYVLQVSDDGVGQNEPLPTDPPKRRGIGKRVIAGLAKNLGGQLEIRPRNDGAGTLCELRFAMKGKRA